MGWIFWKVFVHIEYTLINYSFQFPAGQQNLMTRHFHYILMRKYYLLCCFAFLFLPSMKVILINRLRLNFFSDWCVLGVTITFMRLKGSFKTVFIYSFSYVQTILAGSLSESPTASNTWDDRRITLRRVVGRQVVRTEGRWQQAGSCAVQVLKLQSSNTGETVILIRLKDLLLYVNSQLFLKIAVIL
jgi:hypothetical protein